MLEIKWLPPLTDHKNTINSFHLVNELKFIVVVAELCHIFREITACARPLFMYLFIALTIWFQSCSCLLAKYPLNLWMDFNELIRQPDSRWPLQQKDITWSSLQMWKLLQFN